jgi:hypothetical protein
MRPVTLGDLCAAARVLLAHPDRDWPQVMATLLAQADAADHYRLTIGTSQYGNGTLMAAALSAAPPSAPAIADQRHLAALETVIRAVRTHKPRFAPFAPVTLPL